MPLTRLALKIVLLLVRIDLALALPGEHRHRLLLKLADRLFRRLGTLP